MVVTKLQGGLGNQMFQYAAARALCNKNDCIWLDHQFLNENNINTEHFTVRSYSLLIFGNVRVKRLSTNQRRFFKDQREQYRWFRKLLGSNIRQINQVGNDYYPFDDLKGARFLYLDGYFQSEKYFKNIRKQLLHEFRFPELDPINQQLKERIINTPHAVSLHVRRGDYLKSEVIANVHPVLPLSYYQRAISILTEKYPVEVFVFSDDLEWAQTNIKYNNVSVHFIHQVNETDNWKDMALMTYCQHHIIANSSFSWWGAWLSENSGEKLTPYQWFNNDAVDYNINDFVPDRWTIITYA